MTLFYKWEKCFFPCYVTNCKKCPQYEGNCIKEPTKEEMAIFWGECQTEVIFKLAGDTMTPIYPRMVFIIWFKDTPMAARMDQHMKDVFDFARMNNLSDKQTNDMLMRNGCLFTRNTESRHLLLTPQRLADSQHIAPLVKKSVWKLFSVATGRCLVHIRFSRSGAISVFGGQLNLQPLLEKSCERLDAILQRN